MNTTYTVEHIQKCLTLFVITLGITSREYFTKAYLRPLMEMGLIERSDLGHPNSPQQKYALTKDGKRRIERVAPL
jgi:predicted transcriptional regulator